MKLKLEQDNGDLIHLIGKLSTFSELKLETGDFIRLPLVHEFALKFKVQEGPGGKKVIIPSKVPEVVLRAKPASPIKSENQETEISETPVIVSPEPCL